VVPGVDEMAENLVHAIRSPQEMQEMAERGRERVLERYDWDALANQLERVWLDCAGSNGAET
jgi:glycosyltransferase involved in cell wall biosynthesis